MRRNMSTQKSKRIGVAKTWKLFMGGAFPRTESGRSIELLSENGDLVAHICRASRKDVRNAVEMANTACVGWANRSGYNRGQILHRIAEMMEARQSEFIDAVRATGTITLKDARQETENTIDRMVSMAGWCDKVEQVLGCRNSVAGPYHNMSVPEPLGVVGILAPRPHPLLGLVSMLAPALATGNVVVALASEDNPIPGLLLGEICATSDVPAGVVNILSGQIKELLPHFATHRAFGAVVAAGLTPSRKRILQEGAVDALVRVHPAMDDKDFHENEHWTSPRVLMPFVETKTIWHPIGT
jgi:acyl-CoA reductase-like NAD-dependent aldehyde dehydrogenase